MAHDAQTTVDPNPKTVIRNIGLMLSGDITRPILDADTIVSVGGRITAIGRSKDVDQEGATTIVDGVQTKPIIGAPPFLRLDIGDAPESASPKVTLSRLYAASFSVSSLRATFSSFLS